MSNGKFFFLILLVVLAACNNAEQTEDKQAVETPTTTERRESPIDKLLEETGPDPELQGEQKWEVDGFVAERINEMGEILHEFKDHEDERAYGELAKELVSQIPYEYLEEVEDKEARMMLERYFEKLSVIIDQLRKAELQQKKIAHETLQVYLQQFDEYFKY